ncbi:clathrin interactor EPSIN 1 isoform X1 [Coffea eugenioides]|uniref:clathrin interactor EPSIN 1 isoform X1 n=1 Tax=Coffea eugenioides TaxID=49369 RepID=UPI000F60C63E|nr:clathrin interactor EPSIN 1 isoform X1 [Coffea eugenioides]XP_027181230.1 clathrin interactor EPSIN 1 isoform X1 [Coffea eugenioides]
MDFMKVIDQTVREIKREVNLKVLKVPEIEQKVLDATDDEPWGPHGTALAEIAQATKKFSECQMVMNVIWTRLAETGKNWRFVYKALAVIEYLVAHGSERAVDDIVEHTFQISSLASFEYVEPSGKDVGINVRKKAETIVTLLNDKDKIQEVRNKAAVNRDKYFGLSSTGITYKSGSASFSSGSFQSGDRYGGFGSTKNGDSFRDSYKDRDRYDEDKFEQSTSVKPHRDSESSQGNTSRKGSSRHGSSKGQETKSADVLRTTKNTDEHDKYASMPQGSSHLTNNDDDEFDDFDPRGTSSAKPSTGTSHQVDLFGQDLLGDFMDAPTPASTEKSTTKADQSDVDLFADATFVSATSPTEAISSSGGQKSVDLFASQPAPSSAVSSTVDFFAAPDPVTVTQSDAKSTNQMTSSAVDPFAAVPLNNFDASDPFGAFAQNPANDSSPSSLNGTPLDKPGSQSNLNGSSVDSKPPPKKDGFQVKSGIWADSLSRGIIDLNIAAPKKVNLADVGIVGLTDGSEEKEKGPPPSFYMGRAMGTGSGLGKSGFPSASSEGDDFFSSLSSQQYQFGGFKK